VEQGYDPFHLVGLMVKNMCFLLRGHKFKEEISYTNKINENKKNKRKYKVNII
jgi:hypothetical protein